MICNFNNQIQLNYKCSNYSKAPCPHLYNISFCEDTVIEWPPHLMNNTRELPKFWLQWYAC